MMETNNGIHSPFDQFMKLRVQVDHLLTMASAAVRDPESAKQLEADRADISEKIELIADQFRIYVHELENRGFLCSLIEEPKNGKKESHLVGGGDTH